VGVATSAGSPFAIQAEQLFQILLLVFSDKLEARCSEDNGAHAQDLPSDLLRLSSDFVPFN
jgi:hypothetical protein